jgi:hypothetical protein
LGTNSDEELEQKVIWVENSTANRLIGAFQATMHPFALRPSMKPNPQLVRDGSTINVSLPSPKEALPEKYLQPFYNSVFFFIYFETLA